LLIVCCKEDAWRRFLKSRLEAIMITQGGWNTDAAIAVRYIGSQKDSQIPQFLTLSTVLLFAR
jgi:hypothetical protein